MFKPRFQQITISNAGPLTAEAMKQVNSAERNIYTAMRYLKGDLELAEQNIRQGYSAQTTITERALAVDKAFAQRYVAYEWLTACLEAGNQDAEAFYTWHKPVQQD